MHFALRVSGFRREADAICALLEQRMIVISYQRFWTTYVLVDGTDRLS